MMNLKLRWRHTRRRPGFLELRSTRKALRFGFPIISCDPTSLSIISKQVPVCKQRWYKRYGSCSWFLSTAQCKFQGHARCFRLDSQPLMVTKKKRPKLVRYLSGRFAPEYISIEALFPTSQSYDAVGFENASNKSSSRMNADISYSSVWGNETITNCVGQISPERRIRRYADFRGKWM